MAKSTKSEDTFRNFADRLKTEPVPMPIQKVVPVAAAAPAKEEETQLTVRIPISLMKKLKRKALDEDTTAKDIVIDALNAVLKTTPI